MLAISFHASYNDLVLVSLSLSLLAQFDQGRVS